MLEVYAFSISIT